MSMKNGDGYRADLGDVWVAISDLKREGYKIDDEKAIETGKKKFIENPAAVYSDLATLKSDLRSEILFYAKTE